MKRVLSFALLFLITISVFSQKKELKKIEKLINSGKYGPANNQLKEVDSQAKGTEYESYLYFLYGKNAFGKNNKKNFPTAAKFFNKVLDTELGLEKAKYSGKSISYIKIINDFYFSTIADALSKNNFESAGKTYETYSKIYPERRDLVTLTLYSYQNAKNKNKVEKITEKLLKLDKEPLSYNASNKYTKREDEFFKKSERDNAIKKGTHENPKDVKIKTKTRIDYYNILVRIYDKKEENQKALKLLEDAKKEFPENTKFVEDYATVVLKTGDKEAYIKALEDLLKVKPDNRDTWINLGIVNQDLKKNEAAISAYDKAIEVDPNYSGAYINKGLVIMSEEQSIINELNQNLRNKEKHAEISKKLEAMYLRAIPAFEKAYELKPSEGIKGALINLYNATEQKEKATALE
ncbi:tetratricopeptide (TPR) repeat protein [Wenyingzhuangia heitensis]|uniref:Tetratricopeptide (TPR) repeat protein n=1 Tax=Wenyingzhuangia heitensis TaxID=1487859 RepID=A0ABX0UCA1_9FLAO|nr:hypothetical protein [Wenyingzhuangia heitensis]NIJ45969.1 tetratricopeptide (TPR) repeat protein [Wenyingzhuangia heitensis]